MCVCVCGGGDVVGYPRIARSCAPTFKDRRDRQPTPEQYMLSWWDLPEEKWGHFVPLTIPVKRSSQGKWGHFASFTIPIKRSSQGKWGNFLSFIVLITRSLQRKVGSLYILHYPRYGIFPGERGVTLYPSLSCLGDLSKEH